MDLKTATPPQTNTQHGNSVLIAIISSVLVSAIVFGGLGYYLGVTQEQDTSEKISATSADEPLTPLATPTQSPTTSNASNVFNVMTAKVGDKLGDFTIKSIEPYLKDDKDTAGVNASGGKLDSNNAKIAFTGESTITGNYEFVDHESGIGGSNEICIKSLDETTLKKFPLGSPDEKPSFCFTNQDLAKSLVTSTVGAKGTVTAVIKDYTYVSYPSEVSSSAALVRVISKK